MTVRVLVGDALAQLRTLPAESVQVCVTSPPYYGLRAYGTNPQVWGGDAEHGHEWSAAPYFPKRDGGKGFVDGGKVKLESYKGVAYSAPSDTCPCGAWRGELGSEPTPALFLEHLVAVFDEVKRVLRPDATLWVNLGDSYAGSNNGSNDYRAESASLSKSDAKYQGQKPGLHSVRAKSLLLIPERFAIAMQEAGWIVRSRIAWCKTSAMPESVRDRPSSAWEHIFLFSKQGRYFYDADAVRQPNSLTSSMGGAFTGPKKTEQVGNGHSGLKVADNTWNGANLRNFWLLGPEPLRLNHYAAYPSEIPRRAILAGTSERGQCPACGAPWRRVVERVQVQAVDAGGKNALQEPDFSARRMNANKHARRLALGDMSAGNPFAHPPTTGWQATCRCAAGEPVPQTVLDPFLGSGTTALVADQLGRNAVGIELSQDYARMAEARIRDSAPMFVDLERSEAT